MRLFLLRIILIVCASYPFLVNAGTANTVDIKDQSLATVCTVPTPNINGWEIINESRIEIRVSDRVVAYLGIDTEYRNPADFNDIVRVVSRHIPIIISKQKDTNNRQFGESITNFYNQREEEDRFKKIYQESDPIIYIRWRVKKDGNLKSFMLDGDIDIWFLKTNGKCLIAKNKKVIVESLTENIGDGKTRNIFTGRKYQVGDDYHILRIDRHDLAKLLKESG